MTEQKIILYVDDDQDYLDMLRAIIESEGYEMVEARSAEEGLQLFREVAPDLVIVDLMMEEVDSGTSFVKELIAGDYLEGGGACNYRSLLREVFSQ